MPFQKPKRMGFLYRLSFCARKTAPVFNVKLCNGTLSVWAHFLSRVIDQKELFEIFIQHFTTVSVNEV